MILCAVSGGIDSMCLAEKVRLEGGPFAIAHCNFCLRGTESDGDEELVRSWAASHGILCHVRRFDTLSYASQNKLSVEMAARELRYRWFGELCREHGYTAVAVAHNANDNAETLILNLLRGTGLRGIIGMKAEGFLPVPEYSDIPLLRPLLDMTREDIQEFASEHGLPWREDSTNAQNEYKRNKIRNLVFPVFKEINPSFIRTLNEDMKRFSEGMYSSETFGPSVLVPPTASGSGPLPFMKPRAATVSDEYIPSETKYILSEEEWDGSKPVKQAEGELIMDADKIGGNLLEGHWESGDWIRPLGAPGKKKMQDWFTDHHIPAWEKPYITLYRSPSDHHHILAVAGRCIDHSVRVTSSTLRIFRILPEE